VIAQRIPLYFVLFGHTQIHTDIEGVDPRIIVTEHRLEMGMHLRLGSMIGC